jgi:hypothetical protein
MNDPVNYANVIPVPTLSPEGWVVSLSGKADRLFAHFYVSDKKQSRLYGDNVANIQSIVAEYGHDATEFTQQIRGVLERYLLRYYQAVDITAFNTDGPDNVNSTYDVSVSILITEDGKQFQFSHLINMVDGLFAKIVREGNTGE